MRRTSSGWCASSSRSLELDEARWVPREIAWFINAQKDEGLRPKQLSDGGDPTRRQMIRLYEGYEESCRRGGVVDFAELLLRSYELWREVPGLADHYRRRFGHILVDEFQDTNAIQYAWLKALAGATSIPFVVGDDDQSIYRWRGARVENLQQFRKDFHGAQLFRLEQNYRSTGTILAAANAIIAHNSGRIGKKLWTSGEHGTPIRLYRAFNERDEAEFVVGRIREWSLQGGQRARDRHPLSLERPVARVRGIPARGARSVSRVRRPAGSSSGRRSRTRSPTCACSPIATTTRRSSASSTCRRAASARARSRCCASMHAPTPRRSGGPVPPSAAELGAKAAASLQAFLRLIETLDAATQSLPLHEQVDHVLQASGLVGHYQKEKADKGEARLENLEELVSAARGFEPEDDSMSALAAFLSHAVLESGEGQAEEWEDCVQMMTLHSAKGLEFPVVFLCGLEDGLFPHQRSVTDVQGLEEERRLCYVGATRAMRAALSDVCRAAPHARGRQLRRALALHRRGAGRAHRGGAAAGPGVAPELRAGQSVRGGRLRGSTTRRRMDCGSVSASATRSSATASCSTSRAMARTPRCRSTSSGRAPSG